MERVCMANVGSDVEEFVRVCDELQSRLARGIPLTEEELKTVETVIIALLARIVQRRGTDSVEPQT